MGDDVPSPARERRRPAEAGPTTLPWEGALYAAVQGLERRAEVAERERDDAVRQLVRVRAECRRRLENWKLRQQAWARERNELLRRLGEI